MNDNNVCGLAEAHQVLLSGDGQLPPVGVSNPDLVQREGRVVVLPVRLHGLHEALVLMDVLQRSQDQVGEEIAGVAPLVLWHRGRKYSLALLHNSSGLLGGDGEATHGHSITHQLHVPLIDGLVLLHLETDTTKEYEE